MKAVVDAFNQEKALVRGFSVITNLRMELFEALVIIDVNTTSRVKADPILSTSGGSSLCSWVLDRPHSGCSWLLQVPSTARNSASFTHAVGALGHVSEILEPFSENCGSANLPWSLSSLNAFLSG